MKKANSIKILSALLMAMTTLCGCSGATNDSSSSSSATMSSVESSSTDDSSSNDPYLEALNITYTLDEENHTYTVTGVKDKQAENIDLPRQLTIDNVIYVLVRMGDFAFFDCRSLTTITIPDSVTSIERYAFENCTQLQSVTFEPNSKLESIGGYAFKNCSSLTSITIPSNVTSIGEDAFENCIQLQSVTFEPNNKLKNIGVAAFYRCYSLTSITIPSSVTNIGNYAFYGCSSLTIYCEVSARPSGWDDYWNYDNWNSRYIPVYWGINEINFIEKDGIQYVIINEEAVITRYVGTSTNVEIPTTIEFNGKTYDVTSIGGSAFFYCRFLTSITIPSSVTSIGEDAFRYCHSLTIYCEASSKPSGWDSDWNYSNRPVYWGINENNFIEKDGIQYVIIDEEAVVTRYVGTSTNVEIPTTIEFKGKTYDVTSIGGSAFFYCGFLTSITIPSSVTSIGEHAFHYCDQLQSVTFEPNSKLESIGDYAFSGCSSLTNITIPNSVTSIGGGAFFYCRFLTSITIPSSVTSIGNNAFYWCNSLIIYCEASSKPNGWSSNWNYSDRPVYWGNEWHYENGVPTLN